MIRLKSFMQARSHFVIGSYKGKATIVAGLMLAQLVISNPAIAEDSAPAPVELRPAPVAEPAPVAVAGAPIPQKEKSKLEKLLYPAEHPIKTAQALVYPAVHPIKTTLIVFDKFCAVGKWSEHRGLTAGLTLVGALGNTVTPALLGVFR